MTAGIVAIAVGVYFAIFRNKSWVYEPTGSRVFHRSLYFSGGDKERAFHFIDTAHKAEDDTWETLPETAVTVEREIRRCEIGHDPRGHAVSIYGVHILDSFFKWMNDIPIARRVFLTRI